MDPVSFIAGLLVGAGIAAIIVIINIARRT